MVTLDTKDQEAGFLVQQIKARGHKALLLDIGVVGIAGIEADMSRAEVVKAGGGNLEELLKDPTREKANPFVVNGCIQILKEKIDKDEVHAVLGLGGTQGTLYLL